MKQSGKMWTDQNGDPTQAKHLPKWTVLQEKLGQKIASSAVDLRRRLEQARALFIQYADEVLRNTPSNEHVKTKFTFTTYDKEFKFEYELETKHVRVYIATKKNPGFKDYAFINLDINSASSVMHLPAESLNFKFESNTIIKSAGQQEEVKELVPDPGRDGVQQQAGTAELEVNDSGPSETGTIMEKQGPEVRDYHLGGTDESTYIPERVNGDAIQEVPPSLQRTSSAYERAAERVLNSDDDSTETPVVQ